MENFEHLSLTALANAVNIAFLQPMRELDPFNPKDKRANRVFDQFYDMNTPWETYKRLNSLSISKAPGADEVPNFV